MWHGMKRFSATLLVNVGSDITTQDNCWKFPRVREVWASPVQKLQIEWISKTAGQNVKFVFDKNVSIYDFGYNQNLPMIEKWKPCESR